MAGSRGIFEVQGSNQCFVVARNGLFVFFQACDVSGYSIFCYLAGFLERSSISHATGQRRDDSSKTAFRLWSENNVVAISGFGHLYGDSIRPR